MRAETLACDLSDAEARAAMLERLGELGLTVEVLVNNAGFGSGGLFQELDQERELQMVRLNVEAVVDLCGRYVPEMVRAGRGAVLNVASTASFQPLPKPGHLRRQQGVRDQLHRRRARRPARHRSDRHLPLPRAR